MGVTFPAITFRAPSQHRLPAAAASANGGEPRRSAKKRRNLTASAVAERRRRRWWSLCRDGGGAKPASLGEFLEVERRFGDAAAELEGEMVAEQPGNGGVNGRLLFADGRVLPPADDAGDGVNIINGWCLWRFPVSLTGICSGGTG
ncbi:Signal recognition particle family protein [Salix suchowensis]|nr:Signal recognition particle family protein [Salix suchowensis]